ncbi:hypothetical protein GWI33_019248 [Rhynchophorus ferrugineus]|uniref:Uncharacterized protein n=1 Tax=Rhynchophorus ferrugineus TaxID=354439 RepID=A0A834HRT7_RHYFE|nr:hypothetical protein GWI33_019248 [Rhynchophorus ferrugineus]
MWTHKIWDLLDYHEEALDVIDDKLVKMDASAADADVKMIQYIKKIMDKQTAYEVWEALKQNLEASSKDQLFKICTVFLCLVGYKDKISQHTLQN